LTCVGREDRRCGSRAVVRRISPWRLRPAALRQAASPDPALLVLMRGLRSDGSRFGTGRRPDCVDDQSRNCWIYKGRGGRRRGPALLTVGPRGYSGWWEAAGGCVTGRCGDRDDVSVVPWGPVVKDHGDRFLAAIGSDGGTEDRVSLGAQRHHVVRVWSRRLGRWMSRHRRDFRGWLCFDGLWPAGLAFLL